MVSVSPIEAPNGTPGLMTGNLTGLPPAGSPSFGIPSSPFGPSDGVTLDPLNQDDGRAGSMPNLSAFTGTPSQQQSPQQQDSVQQMLALIEMLIALLEQQQQAGDSQGAQSTQSALQNLANQYQGQTGSALPMPSLSGASGGGAPGSGGGGPPSSIGGGTPGSGGGAPSGGSSGGGSSPSTGGGSSSSGSPSSSSSSANATPAVNGPGPTIPTNENPNAPTVIRDGKPIGAHLAPYFDKMVAAAKKDGVNLQVESGWRSRAEQVQLWNQYGHNPARVAPPGSSNHEKGNAIDFKSTPGAFDWLKKNGSKFGFHNYPPEPWHYSTNGK